jgi:hypothetical protein
MADKASRDPAADLVELKAYIDNFNRTAWHKSTDDAIHELTLLQQRANAAIAQVGTDMPDDVQLWARGIARDAARALDAAKALDPALAGNPRDEPALVELTKRLDQIASNAEYAANGIRSMPPPSPPAAPPDVVDQIDLSRPAAPAAPVAPAAPDPPGQLEHLEGIIQSMDMPGGPLEQTFGIPPTQGHEIVPNPVPLHERTAMPESSAMPGTTHHVIEGAEQSMLPELVPEPGVDLSALPGDAAVEEPGIWNPDPLVEAEHGLEPPAGGDDLA